MANLDSLSTRTLVTTAGVPYAGARASYWADVGATVPLNTFSDAGLTSANTNPVVADSSGTFGAIYLSASRYWRTVTDSALAALTRFNSGPIDGALQLVTSAASPSPTYPFLWWSDTTTGNLKRRSSNNASWLDFGPVDGLIAAATVTEQLTGTSAVKSSTPDSVAALWQRGTAIASAATISLPATGGEKFTVTGTIATSGISSAQGGREIQLTFAGGTTLTHNGTSFILLSGASEISIANCVYTFVNQAAQDAAGSDWRCTNQSLRQVFPQGYISGLTLSRASATTFGVATGAASNEGTGAKFDMAATSAFTKSTAAWAVGTGNGGIDTGAVSATAWYHVHMIRKDSDSTIDYMYSLSVAAPTMPTGYTARRRIGSLLTNGSSQFVAFSQVGEEFLWDAAVVDADAVNPGTSAVTRTLTTPLGVKTTAILSVGGSSGTSPGFSINVTSLDVSDQATQAPDVASLTGFTTGTARNTAGGGWTFSSSNVRTNLSSQVRSRISVSAASDRLGIITRGWIDARGKDG